MTIIDLATCHWQRPTWFALEVRALTGHVGELQLAVLVTGMAASERGRAVA